LTPVVIPCSDATAGGVGPAGSLQYKKRIPGRKAERQVRPLGSKLIPAPKQVIATRQAAFCGPTDLRSMPAKINQRMGAACPSAVPTTHGSHGSELHVGGRSLAQTVGALDTDGTEAAPTIPKIRPPSLKPNSVGKSQITKGGPQFYATKISQIVKRHPHAPRSTKIDAKT